MFKRNEGTIDRLLRLAVAIVFMPAAIFWLGALQGTIPGLVALAIGLIGLVTALTGFCLPYALFGVSTLEPVKKQSLPSYRGSR